MNNGRIHEPIPSKISSLTFLTAMKVNHNQQSIYRMPRFNKGDRVRIRPNEPTPFAGLGALVQEVQPDARNVATLDRYIVAFDWGERQAFYDAQLLPTER
jgi:hypothetical protein